MISCRDGFWWKDGLCGRRIRQYFLPWQREGEVSKEEGNSATASIADAATASGRGVFGGVGLDLALTGVVEEEAEGALYGNPTLL